MFLRGKLLATVNKDMLGLEVAPWFRPIASKADGYNIRTLDVFDDTELMTRAKADESISPDTYGQLEPVDYVGSATEIGSLVEEAAHGTFDYVLSSHNFEHLPNPIKFLQGCESILKPGGQLIMVLPDGRACFDHFRPHTEVDAWLEAFLEDRSQPSNRQVFGFRSNIATSTQPGQTGYTGVSSTTPAHMIQADGNFATAWASWIERSAEKEYIDAHCSVFTPSSFQLLIEDCRALSLTAFEIAEVGPCRGVEFCVRLVRREHRDTSVDAQQHLASRTRLLRAVWAEHAARISRTGQRSLADMIGLQGASIGERVRIMLSRLNRKRRARRRARKA